MTRWRCVARNCEGRQTDAGAGGKGTGETTWGYATTRTEDVACGVPGSTDTSLSLFLDILSLAACALFAKCGDGHVGGACSPWLSSPARSFSWGSVWSSSTSAALSTSVARSSASPRVLIVANGRCQGVVGVYLWVYVVRKVCKPDKAGVKGYGDCLATARTSSGAQIHGGVPLPAHPH